MNNEFTEVILQNVRVVIRNGVSQKTNKPYQMVCLLTGDQLLDREIKPMFLSPLVLKLLLEENNKKGVN